MVNSIPASMRNTPTDWTRVASVGAEELLELLVNDLEPAAFSVAPWLKAPAASRQEILVLPVHMTGSGSTLFTVSSSSVDAYKTQATLEKAIDNSIACIAVKVSI